MNPAMALLYFIAIMWVITGAALVIFTDQTRTFLQKCFQARHMKIPAVIAIIIGLTLIFGGMFRRDILFLSIILGILAVGKGLFILSGSERQFESILDWLYVKMKSETLRFWGLTIFTLGIVLLSCLM
jgi:hypothetical protein